MLTRTCVLLAGLLTGTVAEAEVVVGAGFGVSQLEDENDIDDGRGRSAHVAYQRDDGVYFELAGMEADIWSIELSAVAAGAGFRTETDPDSGLAMFFKGGLYTADTEGPEAGDGSRTGYYFGLGLDWMWTPGFGLRFDLQVLDVIGQPDDVAVVTVGPVVRFGVSR